MQNELRGSRSTKEPFQENLSPFPTIKINCSLQRKDKNIHSLVLTRLLWKECFLWAIIPRWRAFDFVSGYVTTSRLSGSLGRGHVGWPCFIFAYVVMGSNVPNVGKFFLSLASNFSSDIGWKQKGSVEVALFFIFNLFFLSQWQNFFPTFVNQYYMAHHPVWVCICTCVCKHTLLPQASHSHLKIPRSMAKKNFFSNSTNLLPYRQKVRSLTWLSWR